MIQSGRYEENLRLADFVHLQGINRYTVIVQGTVDDSRIRKVGSGTLNSSVTSLSLTSDQPMPVKISRGAFVRFEHVTIDSTQSSSCEQQERLGIEAIVHVLCGRLDLSDVFHGTREHVRSCRN